MKNHLQFAVSLACTVLLLAGIATAQVRVVGPGNVQLSDLEGSPTLVTVVLRGERPIPDPNLQIIEVLPNALNVQNPEGHEFSYLFEQIAEVRVQGDVVERPTPRLSTGRPLRAQDQLVVDRANTRAREIFETLRDNQNLRMDAAALVKLRADLRPNPGAEYLQQLLESNDLETQINAALRQFLAGERPPVNIVQQGLDSGNRRVRIIAMQLAGMMEMHEATARLNQAMNDRADELATPAVRALARLGNREMIPRLLGMLTEASETKAAAAVDALVRLGGEEVAEQMKLMLPNAQLRGRYRILLVLHKLGDPMGRRLLQETMQDVPTLQLEAALHLAKGGDQDAMLFLRRRLGERVDVNERNMIMRARMAAAVIEGGDPGPTAILQELLRSDIMEVRLTVCDLIAELGNRRLLTILQSPLESADNELAVRAGQSVLALADPDFQDRLLQARGHG